MLLAREGGKSVHLAQPFWDQWLAALQPNDLEVVPCKYLFEETKHDMTAALFPRFSQSFTGARF